MSGDGVFYLVFGGDTLLGPVEVELSDGPAAPVPRICDPELPHHELTHRELLHRLHHQEVIPATQQIHEQNTHLFKHCL